MSDSFYTPRGRGGTMRGMNPLRLQCRCGALGGHVGHLRHAVRGVCYCKDCRAYARHLGQEPWTHDAQGRAGFLATQARHVSLTHGIEQLACLSLSESGLLRWYTRCCNTPIGGTPRNWKLPYVGLVHTCLTAADPAAFERAFPQVQMRVNAASARQAPTPMRWGTALALAGFMPRLALGGVTGTYRQTPFFHASTGTPVAAVEVLTAEQRARAYEGA